MNSIIPLPIHPTRNSNREGKHVQMITEYFTSTGILERLAVVARNRIEPKRMMHATAQTLIPVYLKTDLACEWVHMSRYMASRLSMPTGSC